MPPSTSADESGVSVVETERLPRAFSNVTVVEHGRSSDSSASQLGYRWTASRVSGVLIALGGVATIIASVSASKGRGAVAGDVAVLLITFAVMAALFWLLLRRGRKLGTEAGRILDPSGHGWTSPIGFFMGPFDDTAGVAGSASFGPAQNRRRGAVGSSLLINETGLTIFRPQKQEPEHLACPVDALRSIDLFKGSEKDVALKTPGRAAKIGRVVITTNDGRAATVTGIPTAPISALMTSMGARVEQS
jgi:hypothetical protein